MFNPPASIAAAFRAATYSPLSPRRGAIDPVLIPAHDAFEAISCKRTFGLQLIEDGHIAARKLGNRLLVEVASVHEFVSSLPVAGRGDTRGTLNRARREMLGALMRYLASGADPDEVAGEVEATVSAVRQIVQVSKLDEVAP